MEQKMAKVSKVADITPEESPAVVVDCPIPIPSPIAEPKPIDQDDVDIELLKQCLDMADRQRRTLRKVKQAKLFDELWHAAWHCRKSLLSK